MCGINGIIAHHTINVAAANKMNQALAHRGPDGQRTWTSANHHIVLGHARLAILDLNQQSDQPMLSANHQQILTYNGEIYNFLELKQELIRLRCNFETQGDTEVILQAYAAWGIDCVKHFNGMFAFCLIDLEKNIAFFARDRYGEKPLLFFHNKDFFSFSSEYKALFTLKEIPIHYDASRLLSFLNFSSHKLDTERDTIFNGVQQLLSAERMVLDLKTMEKKIDRYWDITDFSSHVISEKEAIEKFKALLFDSVRLRLRSDVKVGSCLSGGLDSTSIVAIVRELQGPDFPYHTFTGRFPGTSADEWPFAQHTVESKRVISHITEPTGEEFVRLLPRLMLDNELPFSSASQFAQWKVFQAAKQEGVTVLLDGQGADEILGGYEQYFQYYLQDIYLTSSRSEYRQELKNIKARYPKALLKTHQQLTQLLSKKFQYFLAQHLNRGSNFMFGLTEDAINAVRDTPFNKKNISSHLKSALYRDSFHHNLSTLLRYGDRNSMAHSREVRLPFCDYRIAEFVLTLPPSLLMGQTQTKRLLRESMSGLIPKVIQQRWNKQGFLPPQNNWMQHELGKYIEQILHQPEFTQRGFWNCAWWNKAWKRFQQGDHTLSNVLWKMMIGESWLQHFVKPMQTQAKVSIHSNESPPLKKRGSVSAANRGDFKN